MAHSAGNSFYLLPCIPYERQEFEDANNHYNCPIVTSYAENIKNNMDEITNGKVNFKNPFMSFKSEDTLSTRLIEELPKNFQFRLMRSDRQFTSLGQSSPNVAKTFAKKEKKPLHIWIRPVNVVSSLQGAHTTSIRKYTMEFRN